MRIIFILLGYIKWHYSRALYSLTKIWGTFLSFILSYFSIRLLFKNFFAPWKRMTESYPKHFNLKKYFFAFLVNSIVRIVGMIMRGALIIIGLFVFILLLILYPVALIIWLVLPFVALALIGCGISLIAK